MTGKQMVAIIMSDAKAFEGENPVNTYYRGFIFGAMFGAKYPEDVVKIVPESGMNVSKFNVLAQILDGLHAGPPDAQG